MRLRLFFIIVAIEIAAILFLVVKPGALTRKKVSANIIPSKEVVKQPSGSLKYYYELQPNTILKTNGWNSPATYTINKDGLNERYDYSEEKPAKTFRIVTLGDSFTYGLHVDTKNNYSERLEDFLNSNFKCKGLDRFEVINLGMWGYDFDYAIERFRTKGVKYRPDLLILFATEIERIDEIRIPLINLYRNKLEKDPRYKDVDPDRLGVESWNLSRSIFLKQYSLDSIYDHQLASLQNLNNYYKGPLLLMSLYIDDNFSKRLHAYMVNRPHTYYLSEQDFNKNKQNILEDGHPSIHGHEKLAKDLFAEILKSNLITCE